MSSLLSELMTSGGWMLHAGRANKPCGLGDHPTPASQSGGTPRGQIQWNTSSQRERRSPNPKRSSKSQLWVSTGWRSMTPMTRTRSCTGTSSPLSPGSSPAAGQSRTKTAKCSTSVRAAGCKRQRAICTVPLLAPTPGWSSGQTCQLKNGPAHLTKSPRTAQRRSQTELPRSSKPSAAPVVPTHTVASLRRQRVGRFFGP